MKNVSDVLAVFESIRRAQRQGVYAPHKPLLILLSLARVQHGNQRLTDFSQIEGQLKSLLASFGPTSAASSRHYPFWHLRTDADGDLWELQGPVEILSRAPASTPNLGELRNGHVRAGFVIDIFEKLKAVPGLIQAVAQQVLDSAFPQTLFEEIIAATGLDMTPVMHVSETELLSSFSQTRRRKRDPGFRERVLRAYEYRCCVCGFDLRVCHLPAGLEAAHIQWHTTGGPDIEPNGLSLCSLHHKLFDLGAFSIEPTDYRIVYSQHAISGNRSGMTELQFHGRRLLSPQQLDQLPSREFLHWNQRNVFKSPCRP